MFGLQPVVQSFQPVLGGLVFVHLSAAVYGQTVVVADLAVVLATHIVAELVARPAACVALLAVAVVIVPE